MLIVTSSFFQSLRLDFVNHSRVHHIHLINSKSTHMNIFSCHNITISDIKIRAPGNSPNTDGVHIGMSTNVTVSDSTISSGDDCVALLSGTKNVHVDNVKCGPGHGISIGSLGGRAHEKSVEGLVVRNCDFIGTQNGLRIKTWAHSHSTSVSNIVFENIRIINAFNPIFIDQEYCPYVSCDQVILFINYAWSSSTALYIYTCDCVHVCVKQKLSLWYILSLCTGVFIQSSNSGCQIQ